MTESDSPPEPDETPIADETLEASEAPTELASGEDAPTSFPTDLPESIAGYRVVSKLGEGGMGVVFEAEQPHPKRRVALKVIRGGQLVDELQVRMFQREVETLARLKHPNIGAVYDAGRTEGGRHFFAMELVDGEELGVYLTKRPAASETPEIEHRLRLFRQICDAVHYAHQRGVIHRDLKPSNIFVTSNDSASDEDGALPAVKILDFGLARITDTDMAAATILSEVGSIKGTLPYMSPEQARGDPEEIDLRTDVYALGVILYQMLVGALPYETRRASLIEALRVICEEPPKPLRVAWTSARRVDPDLETILGKALEKEASARYASASALSEDVERFLNLQPIQARPPSTTYQLKKLVARNKLPTAFAATVLVLLVGFGIWMSVLFGRATRAEGQARQEAATARQVSEFMTGLFAASDSLNTGETPTLREVVDRGAERVRQQLADQPEIQARLMTSIGRVYTSLFLPDEAAALLEEALSVRERTLAPQDPDLGRSLVDLADVYSRRNDPRAERLLRRGIEILEAALGPDHPDLVLPLSELATMLPHAEAVAMYRRAVALGEKSLGPDHPDLAFVFNQYGNHYYMRGQYREAEPLYERAYRIRQQALSPEHPELGRTRHNLASIYQLRGRFAEALELSLQNWAIAERLGLRDHWRAAYPAALNCRCYAGLEEYANAEEWCRRSLEIHEQGLGTESPGMLMSEPAIGQLLTLLERYEEAERHLQRARDLRQPGSAGASWDLQNLANLFRNQGRYEEAETLYQKAIVIQEEALAPESSDLRELRADYAALLRHTGRTAEVVELEELMASGEPLPGSLWALIRRKLG